MHRLFCPFHHYHGFVSWFFTSLHSLQLVYPLKCFIFERLWLLFSLFYVDKMITVKSHWRFSKWWLTKSHSSIFLDHPKTKKSMHSLETFIMLKKNLINLIWKQIYSWSTFKNQYVLMKFCEYIDAFKWQKKPNIRQEFLNPRQKIYESNYSCSFSSLLWIVFPCAFCKNMITNSWSSQIFKGQLWSLQKM